MSSLKNLSDSELEAELARRAEAKKKAERPQPLPNIDWSPLQKLMTEEIRKMDEVKDYYHDDDFDHWVFETALECVFGKDIWKWWNKHS